MYEQSVQANLSTYIQALQLQMQQQQQWGGSQAPNGPYLQQAQAQHCTADGYSGQQSSYNYDAAAAQYFSQHYAGQQGQQQLQAPTGLGAASTQAQQPQQWLTYGSGLHNTQQGQLQQQQAQHPQAYGFSSNQPAHAQQALAAGQHSQQQGANAVHPGAMVPAAVAAVAASAALHRRSLSGASAGNAHAAGMVEAAAGRVIGAGTAPTAAANAQVQSSSAAAAAMSGVALAAGQEGVSIARRASLSQGSGSVLVHGSVSDADLDSLLGLGSALSPSLGPEQLDSNGLQVMGLLDAGESGLLVPPDDLLAQGASRL